MLKSDIAYVIIGIGAIAFSIVSPWFICYCEFTVTLLNIAVFGLGAFMIISVIMPRKPKEKKS